MNGVGQLTVLGDDRFQASRPDQPAPEEINVIRLAWEDLAA
jgi:hypothetical protein